jgi:hypothetical protein
LIGYWPDFEPRKDCRMVSRCGVGRQGVGAFFLLSIFTRQEIVSESGAVPGELRRVRNGSRSAPKRKSSAGSVA